VGQISESIEVTAGTPLLETETSELGQVVDNKRMANLPLNGRNFAQLALLTAGTAPSEPGARDEGGFGFSANGAQSLQNNFLLDGVDNNSNLPDLLNETNYVIQPSVEALEEFKVQINAYSAEFGRGNCAIINATIKSGTNQFHGSAYEFLRNEKLDSNSEKEVTITLTNPGNNVAFVVRAEVTQGADGNEILPITYDDNYITIFPHEIRTIVARFDDARLSRSAPGNLTPALRVEGYNVAKKVMSLK
jgi:hypothetical protein